VKAAYRKLAKEFHPDIGGDRQRWDTVQQAYEQAEQALIART
jgi:DnaJ-class molecular chaperone